MNITGNLQKIHTLQYNTGQVCPSQCSENFTYISVLYPNLAPDEEPEA